MLSDVAEMTRVLSAVPDDWREVTLGDIITLEYGRSLPEKVRRAGDVAVYGSNGVVGAHDEALVPTGGIIVGRKGTAGSIKVSLGPFWPIDTTYFVKARQTVDWDWLAATLHHARLNELNEATGVPGLNREKAYRQPVSLPTLDEQRRIAEVLRSVDDAIASNQQYLTQAGSVQTALLQQHFHMAEWADDQPLPDGWEMPLLDAVAIRGSGHTPTKKMDSYWNGGIKWVSLQDTKKLDQVYISTTAQQISADGIRNSSAVLHPDGVVVISRDATVGKSAITVGPMAVSQHFIAYRCGETLNNHYLYYWLQRMKPVFERIGAGSTIKTIGLPFFKSLRIALPPLEQQSQIAGVMLDADKAMMSAADALQSLRKVKAVVMSDLLSGYVRVPA